MAFRRPLYGRADEIPNFLKFVVVCARYCVAVLIILKLLLKNMGEKGEMAQNRDEQSENDGWLEYNY